MVEPCVTVAVASCNNAAWLARCLDSVLNQTYRNLEVLVVDDGSTDGTAGVLEGYRGEPRVRILTQENAGLSAVRQRCLEEARGEFLCFIDADDYLLPGHVAAMVSRIAAAGADVCVCSTRVEDAAGNAVERDGAILRVAAREPLQVTPELLSQRHCGLSRLLSLSDSWNKLYRVAFLRQAGVRFSLPKGYNGTDLAFNHKLVLFGPRYCFEPAEGYCHVLYPGSAVRRGKKELQAGFESIVSDLVAEAKRAGCFPLLRGKIADLYCYLLWFALIDRIGETAGYRAQVREVRASRGRDAAFAAAHPELPRGLGPVETRSRRVFLALYRYLPAALPLYFAARRKLTE